MSSSALRNFFHCLLRRMLLGGFSALLVGGFLAWIDLFWFTAGSVFEKVFCICSLCEYMSWKCFVSL